MKAPLIRVMEGGLLTTVQDLGRPGYQALGVSPAGAVDEYALRMANWAVGNPAGAAALEITLIGPRLSFTAETLIAIAGADLGPVVDGEPIPMWTAVPVRAGSVLAFTGGDCGCRAYLAVAGGIDVPPALGSRSTDLLGRFGGLEGRVLRAGDELPVGEPGSAGPRPVPPELVPVYPEHLLARVVLGPQEDHFTSEGVRVFLGSSYQVTPRSDRVGLRLEGPVIRHRGRADVVSDGMPAGAVQVPQDGRPLVVLANRQTVGGYPKIATVVSTDVWRLGQLRPGNRVSFHAVAPEEAHRLAIRFWQLWDEEQLAQRVRGHTTRWSLTISGVRYSLSLEESQEE
ncbi:MAG: biotin-dependent carboxyltransferase family protein [Bacillota bacterium]|nr:biotin-dependent carboxyltransferase family protein [Bacillota bacterium]